MNIDKIYWKWAEALNDTEFRLGGNIGELIDKNLVHKKDDSKQFKGINGFPWIIDVDDENRILSISYRQTFFFLLKGKILES